MTRTWYAFDIDGTLACTREVMRAALAQRVGLPLNHLQDGGMYETFGFTLGSDFMDQQLIEVALDTWRSVAHLALPLPGALETVNRVASTGRLLGYVTRRDPQMTALTRAWLHEHGFPVSTTLLRHMPDNHACKSVQALALALTYRTGGPEWLSDIVLVEDSGREALSAARNGLRVALLDQPHNHRLTHPLITRYESLLDLPA